MYIIKTRISRETLTWNFKYNFNCLTRTKRVKYVSYGSRDLFTFETNINISNSKILMRYKWEYRYTRETFSNWSASPKGRAISTCPGLLRVFEIFLLAMYSSRLLSNKNHKSLLVIFISPFSGTSLRLNVAS